MSDSPESEIRNKVLLQEISAESISPPGRSSSTNSLHWIFPEERIVVGRSIGEATLAYEHDSAMSRRHFELAFDGLKCVLRDLNSANGTYHNNKRVTEVVLATGDQISAGSTKFHVEILQQEQELAAKAADVAAATREAKAAEKAKVKRPDKSPDRSETTSTPTSKAGQLSEVYGAIDEPIEESNSATLRLPVERRKRSRHRNQPRVGQTDALDLSHLIHEPEPPPVSDSHTASGQSQVVSIRLIEDGLGSDPTMFSRFVAWIRSDQRIIVGTSAYEADWRLPRETNLAPGHFEISLDAEGCKIRQIDKKSATKVNGEAITQRMLNNQDRIVAGNVMFVVDIC